MTDGNALASPGGGLTRRQRDFLLVNIYILLQHGYHQRAGVLARAMQACGDDSAEVHLALAVVRFSERCWDETLAELEAVDRIEPIERFGSYRLTMRQKLRRYLRTRCLSELGDFAAARQALDAYLRDGE